MELKKVQEFDQSELINIRDQIDQLDKSIASLLAQRLILAKGIANTKNKLGLSICDADREFAVLKNVSDACEDKEILSSVLQIYQYIISFTREWQKSYITSDKSVPESCK